MGFPIDSYLPDIAKSLKENPAVLLKAEPGAGKTTQVPRYLIDHFQKILVVEPRRLAAKLSAEWVAQQCGSKVGETVGYQIRLDSKKSASTKLLYVTEGILTRLFLQDAELSEYNLIILDEFHERHVQSDIALALVKQLQNRRDDLKLLVMSATLETTLLGQYLNDPPSFDVPGRVFPVSIAYRPFAHDAQVSSKVLSAVQEMLGDPACQGNILVFLSGIAQISQCLQALESRLDPEIDVIPLSAEQAHNYQRIVERPERRKVILSTNVAETSLTLPNIQGVIDNGTARILSFASWSGLPTLEEKKISQASCIQRSGRAGRVAAGVCYRLFSEADFHARAKFTEAEIQRIDLCQVMLELASLSPNQTWDIDYFDWLEKPKDGTLKQNHQLLKDLGALDAKGKLSSLGEKMSEVALHPRLSKIWLEADSLGIGELGLLAALIINEGGLLSANVKPDEHHSSDLIYQMQLLLDGVQRRARRVSLDPSAVQRVKTTYELWGRPRSYRPLSQIREISEKELRYAIFLGFADRVAKYRPLAENPRRKQRHFNFALGRGAVLSENSAVQEIDWCVAVDARESYDENLGQIWSASAVDLEFLNQDPFGLLETSSEMKIDPKAGRARICRQKLYGKLLIEESWEDGESPSAHEVLLSEAKKAWPACLSDPESLDIYHRKLEILTKASVQHDLPKFEGEMLELLIDYILEGVRSLRELKQKSLSEAIGEQLSYEDQLLLKKNCPDEITLAAGKKLKVHYHEEAEPFVASKIQDFFLQKVTPSLAGGRYPLVIKLLAPSQRPAQITKDLAGFWAGSYHEVKKELKRRYPKHPWPDDPANFVMPKREPRS